MTVVLAHVGHWYHAILYLLPLVLVGVGLWWAGRADGEDDEEPDAAAARTGDAADVGVPPAA